MQKIVIFISGRGSNMESIVKETQTGILKGIAEIVLVFSNTPEAKGLETANSKGIKTHCIISRGKGREEFDKEVIEYLKPIKFDYIVLAGYMRILSPFFVDTFRRKIINIHPADTRLHQGLHAYEWAFNKRMESTKITIHYVNSGVDEGEIIAQAEVDLRGVQSVEEVERRGLAVEHKLYPETLKTIFTKQ